MESGFCICFMRLKKKKKQISQRFLILKNLFSHILQSSERLIGSDIKAVLHCPFGCLQLSHIDAVSLVRRRLFAQLNLS